MSTYGAGNVYRRNDSGPWQYSFSVNGEQVRRSSGTTDYDLAHDKMRQHMAMMLKFPELKDGPGKLPLVSLFDGLLKKYHDEAAGSEKTAKSHYKRLTRELGKLTADQLTTQLLLELRHRWRKEGASQATCNRRLAFIQAAWNLGPDIMRHALVPPDWKKIKLKEENVREESFTTPNYTHLRSLLRDPDLEDYCDWAHRTGIRKGEISRTKWTALDVTAWTMTVVPRNTKSRKPRTFPVSDPIFREVLERRLAKRQEGDVYVFMRTLRGGRRTRVRSFAKVWARVCEEAGLPFDPHFHDFRRTGTTNLLKAGLSLKEVKLITGHRTDHMVHRYNMTDLVEVNAKLANYRALLEQQGLPVHGAPPA